MAAHKHDKAKRELQPQLHPEKNNERLNKEIEILQSQCDKCFSIVRTLLQGNDTRKGRRDPSIWLAWLTGFTLLVLIAYTIETDSLRRAAGQQVRATNRQNEISAENAVWPIVVLEVDPQTGALTVKNIGFGPAVNSSDVLMIRDESTKLQFMHAAGLRPGETARIQAVEENRTGRHGIPTPDAVAREIKKVFPEALTGVGVPVCLTYANAKAEWYETRQRILFSGAPELKGISGIIIRYEGQTKVVTLENACK